MVAGKDEAISPARKSLLGARSYSFSLRSKTVPARPPHRLGGLHKRALLIRRACSTTLCLQSKLAFFFRNFNINPLKEEDTYGFFS